MSKQSDFFQAMAAYAQASQLDSGVPASVTLAQAALESGWGEHAKGNNFFGVKSFNMAANSLRKLIRGGAYRHGTTPVPPGMQVFLTWEWEKGKKVKMYDVFEAYATPKESFDAHANFLRRHERYREAFSAPDGIAFGHAIAAAGYATAPDYGQVLELLIRKYNLMVYDIPR